MPSRRIAMSNLAYWRGMDAYNKGVPIRKNPYKDPGLYTSWAVGWNSRREGSKDKSIPRRFRKGLKTIRPDLLTLKGHGG